MVLCLHISVCSMVVSLSSFQWLRWHIKIFKTLIVIHRHFLNLRLNILYITSLYIAFASFYIPLGSLIIQLREILCPCIFDTQSFFIPISYYAFYLGYFILISLSLINSLFSCYKHY